MGKFLGAVFFALAATFIAGVLVNQKAEAPSSEDAVAAGLSGMAAIWSEISSFIAGLTTAGGPIMLILFVGAVFIGILWFIGAIFGALFGGFDIDLDM